VPEGWTQDAQARTPPGRLAQEVMLVEYKLLNTDPPAALLTAIDLAETSDVQTYLKGALPCSESWHELGLPEVGARWGVSERITGRPNAWPSWN
jgi:hypothetical protein